MLIENALKRALAVLEPQELQLVNESANHAGYFEGKESHFKLTIVSNVFTGKRLVQRHQMIYHLVGDLLAPEKIHALAIHAYTANEWQGIVPDSPQCAGQRKL